MISNKIPTKTVGKYFIWKSEVRDYELDYQAIVNNANYFHYLDYARVLYFANLGIDVVALSKNNINAVLVNTNVDFKKSLKAGDKFLVKSCLERISRLKLIFTQEIVLDDESEEIILTSKSLVCCIDVTTGKPCMLDELNHIPIVKS